MTTDFKWGINDIKRIKKYGNFTCRFTSGDGKRVVTTKAYMDVNPLGTYDENVNPSLIRCNNPIWPYAEEVTLDISING